MNFVLNEDNSVTLTRSNGTQVTFDPVSLLILKDSSISGQLIESFGHATHMSDEELEEYSWDQFKSDAGDFGRGALQGVTLGTGKNIAAGIKSALGPGTYKQELEKQIAADRAAQERSPWLYGAGNVAGALAVPIPGGAVANAVVKGTGTAAKVARGAVNVGTNIATQAAVDKAVNTANTKTLGYDPDKYPITPEEIKAFQKAKGLKQDGVIGTRTQQELDKLGLKPPSLSETILKLQQRLATIENGMAE